MYDVVIIGAGVAGSYIGRLLKNKGINVILIDKKDGKDYKDDSGLVSPVFMDLMNDAGVSGHRLVRSKITSVRLFSPDKKTINITNTEPFAYLVNRRLLEESLHAGLVIKHENVWRVDVFEDGVHVWTDKNDYQCKIMVGADGAKSFVRKQLKLPENDVVEGLIMRTKKTIRATDVDVEVFLNKNYSDFFAWHIPKNREFGLIINTESTNKILSMENFKNDLALSSLKQEQIKMSGSPISYGLTKSHANRCILVGDAASQTKPLTFGGIVFSLKCCKHAASVIENAIASNEYSSLSNYEEMWHAELKETIEKQLSFRKIYMELSNEDINKVFEIIGNDVNGLRDYDNPIELWNNLPKWKKIRLIAIGLKGMIKSAV